MEDSNRPKHPNCGSKSPQVGYYPAALDQSDPVAKAVWDKNIIKYESTFYRNENIGKQWAAAVALYKRSCAKRNVVPFGRTAKVNSERAGGARSVEAFDQVALDKIRALVEKVCDKLKAAGKEEAAEKFLEEASARDSYVTVLELAVNYTDAV